MSDTRRSDLACPKCQAKLDEVAGIAPLPLFSLPAAILVCGLCSSRLGVRSKAVLNNLPYERFSIASSDAHGNLDCNADQGHAER